MARGHGNGIVVMEDYHKIFDADIDFINTLGGEVNLSSSFISCAATTCPESADVPLGGVSNCRMVQHLFTASAN